MRKYEAVTIFDPSLNDAQLKDEMKKIETLIKTRGGQEITVDSWGRKEIAYPVGRHKFGHFVSFHFGVERDETGTHAVVDHLVGILRITDSVIKYQVHKIEDRFRKFRGNPKRKPEMGDEFGDGLEADF